MKPTNLKSIDFKSTDFVSIIKKNDFIQKPQKVRHRGRHRFSVPDGVLLGAELQQGTEV
ncbi:hypothetical protein ACNOHN_08765 [Bacteroides zhangwenhongii]|uniref:hypothetical protein n=1 Tax=Bacteroides zhangwenhongii TaxID=2650157 RepID=UPI003AAD640D